MMIKRIIAGLAGIVLCSMSIGVNAKTYIDPSAQKSWLGRGVDSGTGLLKSNCLNGTQVVIKIVRPQSVTVMAVPRANR